MTTIKLAAGCALLAYCESAYEMWGLDGMAASLILFALIIMIYNGTKKESPHDDTGNRSAGTR
jgi:hypothetical protein